MLNLLTVLAFGFLTLFLGVRRLGPAQHTVVAHEINCLILESTLVRNITLPTKVRIVKAMVFPVVMYGCEGWTIKKAEH